MARSRNLLTAGALGVGALALIGAGASATFTGATDNSQTVTSGNIKVALSSPDALEGCTTPQAGCRSISFPAVAAVNSTFETDTHRITITNMGDIPVMEKEINFSDSNNGSSASLYLRAQMNVCVMSGDPAPATPWVVASGPLTKGEGLTPGVTLNQHPSLALAPGGTDWYDVSFYAGQDSARCGHGPSSAGVDDVVNWGTYVTPASLTNDAMGGSVTPSVTFAYTG
jgi:hypothetical protein